jgi:hypothetical protein
LDEDVPGDAPPREVAAQRERDADGRVEVGAGHLAHEQDDRRHHQRRRDHRRRPADRVRERLAHHAAAGRDQHQQGGAEQLGEQPPPLLRRVLEVLYRPDDMPGLVGQLLGLAVTPRLSGIGSLVHSAA